MPNYYVWSEHGEDYDVLGVGTNSHYPNTDYTSTSSQHGSQPGSQPIGFEGNVYAEMVNDAFHGTMPFNEYHEYESGYDHIHDEHTQEAKRFYDMLDAANTPLYDGCHEGHSQLSLASRFMNIKVDNNLSEACMDDWAELFTEVLPEGNQATGSYYETETLVQKIGLPYHTIDVCIENCMLFWKEDGNLEHCKFCGKPRYKSSEGRTRIPFSRMWYLPIADRLKRMFQSEKTASSMRWHAEHDSEDGVMCHSSDAPEWKTFQHLHPTFAQEPQNFYLGLSYLFLTILNSGPNHPRASLDVFLQPLIDELKDLWYNGVEADDISLSENFNMKVVLMWTIRDFPAYGMLSGWTTHGRLACPICMDDTGAFQLPAGRKTCWFDCHRRFLPTSHPMRKNKKDFLKGKDSLNGDPTASLTSQAIYERIRKAKAPKTSVCGGN
ncbi:PREDICTED: uncharacterized protein LOC104704465 [Camelina sativa]|uniref:Uncharacterized protein LOC104704465 n=1 Tax=Camelina sativa TaxID=90675 RepID=A0ABM1Q743_CAMSA|nr:PREDICTED: uncharacterized protein LOC104704465 [Camelina sativa]